MRTLFFVLVLVSAGYISYQEVPEVRRWVNANLQTNTAFMSTIKQGASVVAMQNEQFHMKAMQQEIDALKASQLILQTKLKGLTESKYKVQHEPKGIETTRHIKTLNMKVNSEQEAQSDRSLLDIAERMEMKSLSLIFE